MGGSKRGTNTDPLVAANERGSRVERKGSEEGAIIPFISRRDLKKA